MSNIPILQKKKQLARKKSNRGDPRSTAVIAHAAVRAKRPLWSLIAQQTAQTVLGDGRYIETRRVPVFPALANRSEHSQASCVSSTKTWHIVHDISTQVRSSVLDTTFYPSTAVISPLTPSAPSSTIIEFSKHSIPAVVRRLFHTDPAVRQDSPSPTASNIGVLSCAAGFRPGGGVLKGSSTPDATLSRNTSLLASLASPASKTFFAAAKLEGKQHPGALPLPSLPIPPPLLYSPGVVGFRRADDDRFDVYDKNFDAERDAIPADPMTRELESPPAVEPQSQRAMGEYVAPYYMNVVSAASVSQEVIRSLRDDASSLAARGILKLRISRALRVLAARGNRTLVLGAFGVDEGVPVDLLAQKVVFAIPPKHLAPFQKGFEMRKYEDELVSALME
ncbi:hypothetical protein FA95DRAFT_293544 [Auriscalpium vulgare]|uniref:Uncharacterized protein n=1 Tax=Auriscalpium vulgare TaxID=40419 RepID=A0ACB8RJ90_9AGAM|nr:hypothetical protein FA95DRAFT_293544 [Auriscalpium vulgare]